MAHLAVPHARMVARAVRVGHRADLTQMPPKVLAARPELLARPVTRHDRTVIVLHWAIALLILVLLGIGWYMVGIARHTPARGYYYNLHKSLGIVSGGLIVALLAWRATHSPPPFPASMPAWERGTAHLSHVVFYAFMVASVVAGYLTSSFSGFGPKLFGMPLPYWGWDDPVLRQHFVDLHRVITLVFAVLIALHALAALKHALLDHDGVLARMLPGRRSRLRSDS